MDFDKVPAARFNPLTRIDNDVIEQLRKRSEERRNASEDFAKRMRHIDLYKEQKEKKSLSLSEEKFFARRNEFDAEKEDEDAIERQLNPGEIKRDFFVDEVLNITVDYIEALAGGGVAAK
jgi:hypothetical protein